MRCYTISAVQDPQVRIKLAGRGPLESRQTGQCVACLHRRSYCIAQCHCSVVRLCIAQC